MTDAASVRRQLTDAAVEQARLVEGDLAERTATAANVITERLRGGGKLLAFGNGGGAADAQHFGAELVGRFALDRRAFAAVALTTNSSIVTAIANDIGFEQTSHAKWKRSVRRAMSRSASRPAGNPRTSPPGFVRRANGSLTTVAFTGATPGRVGAAADHVLMVASTLAPRVQEAHILLVHVLCAAIERALVGEPG